MNIIYKNQEFAVSLAESEADVARAQRLRHEIFLTERGAPDRPGGVECDAFDAHCDHLILHRSDDAEALAVTRVMSAEQAGKAGQFYSESEFDITALKAAGRPVLELGRTCVRADYRGGMAMFHLWTALARLVTLRDIQLLFGTASLPGTDAGELAEPLSLLHHRHLAPEPLRAVSRQLPQPPVLPEAQIDRRRAMIALPSLIKSYLRLGGMVGAGAFVDHEFNCTDVLMVMDTARLNARHAQMYQPTA